MKYPYRSLKEMFEQSKLFNPYKNYPEDGEKLDLYYPPLTFLEVEYSLGIQRLIQDHVKTVRETPIYPHEMFTYHDRVWLPIEKKGKYNSKLGITLNVLYEDRYRIWKRPPLPPEYIKQATVIKTIDYTVWNHYDDIVPPVFYIPFHLEVPKLNSSLPILLLNNNNKYCRI